MDFQGYALAFVVALLLIWVMPSLYRRRAVLAATRIDERYAEDLRIIAEAPRQATHEDATRGTLFFRQPEVKMSKSEKAAAQDVRALVKDRARRRARIATRNVNQRNGLVFSSLLGAIAAIMWVLAATVGLPILAAAVGTGVAGIAMVWVSYVRSAILAANEHDEKAIAKIEKKIAAAKDLSTSVAEPSLIASTEPGEVRSGMSFTIEPGFVEDRRTEEDQRISDGVQVTETREPSVSKPARIDRADERDLFPAVAAASVPSYTLKSRAIAKRTVKPYEVPEVAEAAVPYRPKAVGERFDTSEVTAQHKKATDGLAGGSTLDQLLDRRRA